MPRPRTTRSHSPYTGVPQVHRTMTEANVVSSASAAAARRARRVRPYLGHEHHGADGQRAARDGRRHVHLARGGMDARLVFRCQARDDAGRSVEREEQRQRAPVALGACRRVLAPAITSDP